MSDQTFGVKVSPETKEKVAKMIEATGISNKEFFEQMVYVFELQLQKEKTLDFQKDISELETHTNRINQLMINLIQRATTEKTDLQQKIEQIQEERDGTVKDLEAESQHFKELKEEAETNLEALEKRNQELSQENMNQQALIEEYKGKIDQAENLDSDLQKVQAQAQDLKNELENQREAHRDLEMAKERELNQKEIEKEKAVIAAERKSMEKIEKLQEELSKSKDEKYQLELKLAKQKEEQED